MSVYPPQPSMTMVNGNRRRRPTNVGSRELNTQENEMIYRMLGSEAFSLSAAVVQLLVSERGQWRIEIPHGVITLVKDYEQRAYFFRIFDILEEKQLWSLRLYRGFRAEGFPNFPKLLYFDSTTDSGSSVYGVNFASTLEAEEFKSHLDRRHALEKKSSGPAPPPQIAATEKKKLYNMWMVVREDQSGRLHYQYHEIPSNAIGIPAPTAPTTTTVTPSVQQYPRFGRGGLPSFPNYASPSTRSSRKVDVEQYDNVDYGYTSYEPERTHYGRCYVPMTPEAFYYYSKQKNMQHVRHQQPQIMTHPRLPSPDYSPIRNRVRFNVPVSSGEYVSYEKKRSDDEIYEYARIGDVSFDPDPKDEVYAYLRTVDENSSSGASTTSSLGATTPPPVPPLPPPTARMERFSRITRGKPVVDRYQYGGGASSAAALPNRSAPIPYTPASQGITQMGTIAAHHQPQPQDTGSGGSWFSRKDKKKKDKKKIIRKEDISNPTNFQHKAHVGWDQDNGFSNKVYDQEMDESTKNILLAAGMKIDDLNEDERRFAEKFIAKNYDKYVSVDHLSASSSPAPPMPTAMPAVSSYSSSPAATNYAPSVPRQQKPSINYISSPMAPPAPPRVESHGIAPARPPPPPPSTQRDRAAAPARPLPQVPPSSSSSVPPPPPPLPSISSSAPPPPPPPPPMAPMGAGAPPPPPPPPPPMTGGATSSSNILANLPPPQQNRGNLLAEIQAGKQLKSVSQSNISTTSSSGSGDARGDVMAQIRQGAQLRHVDPADAERRKSSNTGMAGAAGMGGLAGALAKALEERRQNMGIDDSSDEEQDDDDKNEWSD